MPLPQRRPKPKSGSPLDALRKGRSPLPKMKRIPSAHRREEEEDAPPPPPPKSPMPLYLGIGGGIALLLILGVAFSGGSSGGQRRSRPSKPEPAPVVQFQAPEPKRDPGKFGGQTPDNTGSLMWICSNAGNHEDKEVLISDCPKCGKKNKFCAYSNSTYCYSCEAEIPDTSIKCPECGRPPDRRVRIKQR